MSEIEINGVQYLTTRLGVMKAWHVARKIFPYLVSTAAMARVAQDVALGHDVPPEKFEGALKTVADSISGMSTSDWNYVMNICLGAVRRRDPGTGNLRPVIQLSGSPEEEANLLFEAEWDCSVPIALTMEVANSDVVPFLPGLMSSLLGLRPANGLAGEPMMASSASLTASSTS